MSKFPNLYKYELISGDYGVGWNDLVLELSEQLEQEILQFPEEDQEKYYAVQVKEKFGGLRFYMSRQTETMTDLIQKAEETSITICEMCGEPGELRRDGWWKTLCDKHNLERRKKKND